MLEVARVQIHELRLGDLMQLRAREGDFDAMGSLKNAIEQLEKDLIHQGLIRTHWNKSQLAKELGISRSNLITKVERYGLDKKSV